MQRTHTRAAIWIVAAVIIGTPTVAWACSCVTRSPCSAFATADAVFLGEVVDVRREGRNTIARLKVTRTWRGTVDSTVTVVQEAGSSCSFDVGAGDRFLVYGRGKGSMFTTHVCAGGGGVVPDGEPEPDLPPRAGRVTGRVLRWNEAFTSHDDTTLPMGDTRVSIQTAAGPIETRTDATGGFTLDDVPAGVHTVHADVGSALEGTDRVALQSPSDCASVLIIPRLSGRLSGRLTSAAGLPLEETEIYAIPVDHDWSTSDLSHTYSRRALDDGAFEFSGLKPGKYFLTVNVVSPARVRHPYPPTYYPGVESRQEAVALEIGSGSVPPLAPFVLGRTLPRTTIAAEIVCRDGSLPRSGAVYAKQAESRSFFEESTYTKVEGRFQLPVMAGVMYDVSGEVLVKGRDSTGRRLRTSEVRLNSAVPPPVVQLIAPLDRCDETTTDGSGR